MAKPPETLDADVTVVEQASNKIPRPSRENNFNLGRELTEEESTWVNEVCAKFPDDEGESDHLDSFSVDFREAVISGVDSFYQPGMTRNDAVNYVLDRTNHGFSTVSLDSCRIVTAGESISGYKVLVDSQGYKVAVYFVSGQRHFSRVSSQDDISQILIGQYHRAGSN